MSDNVSRILDTVLPSSLIGKYVKLKPLYNKSFIGLCPFHLEKSPSFRVNDEKRFFYCFGCNKGGDIFNFLQEYKNISFVESLKEISESYGIKIDYTSSVQYQKIKNLKDLLNEITDIFYKQLFLDCGKNALNYITKDRGLKTNTLEHFKIGYCPKESDFLISYFPENIENLVNLGLLSKQKNGEFYSFFQDRIIFPILDIKGDTIAFAGRIYKKEQSEIRAPKYINSKESEVFKKNKTIYNLNNAKKSRQDPILLEGYLDVISMTQAGFSSAVAQMGTAISAEGMDALFEITGNIIFCYDNDEAGKKAEKRAIEIASSMISPTKSISFLKILEKDVDEFLQAHPASAMSNLIESAIPLHEKMFQNLAYGVDFKNPQSVSLLEKNLLDFTKTISDSILKKNFANFFKDKIFITKTSSKNLKNYNDKVNVQSLKGEIKPLDAILFLFLSQNPQFLENDLRIDNFIPFSNVELENKLRNKISYKEDAQIKQIMANYSIPSFQTEEEMEGFYLTIYKQFLIESLQSDVAHALKKQDFTKAKYLQQEIIKIKNSAS